MYAYGYDRGEGIAGNGKQFFSTGSVTGGALSSNARKASEMNGTSGCLNVNASAVNATDGYVSFGFSIVKQTGPDGPYRDYWFNGIWTAYIGAGIGLQAEASAGPSVTKTYTPPWA